MAGLLLLSGCSSLIVTNVMEPTIDNLQQQKDVDLVCEGAPSFLLMLDSMLASEPDNVKLLTLASQAYGAYTAALHTCGRPERAEVLSVKARDYGLALLGRVGACQDNKADLDELTVNLRRLDSSDVASLFWGGSGWATWLQFQHGSPEALADLLRVEQIMLRVVELDEGFYHGGAHLFLGIYYGGRPLMFGGKPELARHHFDRALALSDRQFLAVQVAYAGSYARAVFDEELYRRLLEEVLDFDLENRPDLYLINQVAKRQARDLLQEAEQYF